MNAPSAPISFVARSDGRLVAFDADRICQSLFAAGERLGRPDAFLARELTDSVVHFLADEAEAGAVRTAQIVEVVEKVVRELGQPDLARAYIDLRSSRSDPPAAEPALTPSTDVIADWAGETPSPLVLERRLGRARLREFSLRNVFARDLAAAHAEGVLTLTTLETPGELAACVLERTADRRSYAEAVLQARTVVGECVVLDGPEYDLAANLTSSTVETAARELRLGLTAVGLRAVVNLNCALPPVWADDLASGPLFGARDDDRDRRQAASDQFCEALLSGENDRSGLAAPSVRVDWHLGERDFTAAAVGRLTRLARRAVEGAPLAFVFDRPRRLVALAEGLDRKHPATLAAVGLHLPRLVRQPGVDGRSEVFLRKLSSLVRLGLSVAKQKREYLRQLSPLRPELSRGFLLDRALLLVTPVGLEAASRSLGGLAAGQILDRLRETLRQDGRLGLVDGTLDATGTALLPPLGAAAAGADHWVGTTAWGDGMTPRQQLKAADAAWSVGDGGTALVRLAEEPLPPEEVVNLVRFAWQQTGLLRLRFIRLGATTKAAAELWGRIGE